MPHSDDETLSLLALGEPVSAEVREHVGSCDRCAAHVTELAALVGAVRAGLPRPAGIQPVPPPASVWSGIAARTGVRVPPRPSEVRRQADALAAATRPEPPFPVPAVAPPAPETPPRPQVRAVPPVPETPPAGTPSVSPADSRTAEMLAEVSPRSGSPSSSASSSRPPVVDAAPPPPRAPRAPASEPRRRGASGPVVFLVAAASLAIGLAAGVAGGRLLSPDDDSGTTSQPRVLDAVTLDSFPANPSAGGTAQIVQTATGRRLDVEVNRLGAPEGFYEVWLIDKNVKKLVPVGILRGGSGEFELPDGMDLKAYPVVDISLEPLDGNPAHSGDSVLRGTLPA